MFFGNNAAVKIIDVMHLSRKKDIVYNFNAEFFCSQLP